MCLLALFLLDKFEIFEWFHFNWTKSCHPGLACDVLLLYFLGKVMYRCCTSCDVGKLQRKILLSLHEDSLAVAVCCKIVVASWRIQFQLRLYNLWLWLWLIWNDFMYSIVLLIDTDTRITRLSMFKADWRTELQLMLWTYLSTRDDLGWKNCGCVRSPRLLII